MDDRLAEWKDQLEAFGPASFIIDGDLRLAWVSDQLKGFLDETDDDEIGIGKPVVEAWLGNTWRRMLTPGSEPDLFLTLGPFLLYEYERRGLRVPDFPEPFSDLLGSIEARKAPEVFSYHFDYVDPRDPSLPPYRVNTVMVAVRDSDGTDLGFVCVGNIGMRVDLLALLARGNIEMYERMANLTRPGTRQAAILFCDLHASGDLSRRLPSATYFDLIRRLWTAIDDEVADNTGIVGKHAGDGASAFFLVDDLGSASGAAAAALRTARAIHETSAKIFNEVVDSPCVMRVGLHWGGALYMGQLVPGGRLDVTALGDEVNECARIQECAGPDETLASKRLVEQLAPEDALGLGLEPQSLMYKTIAETKRATEKAVRDAGSIPVTVV